MKWLESSPQDYDRGISLLTLGRIERIKQHITETYARPGSRVLEIGCGTGSLTLMLGQRGAHVTAIDASPRMLAEAQKNIQAAGLEQQVALHYMDAALIGDRFPSASFDLIVSTLVFSELPPDERRFVLGACRALLAPNGRLLIADEVVPSGFVRGLLFHLVRAPLVILTWLLTRTTTNSLRNFAAALNGAGFAVGAPVSYLGGSLAMFEARLPRSASVGVTALPSRGSERTGGVQLGIAGRLEHRPSLRTRLLDIWLLFFRIIPPYPKVRPGLYAVGSPQRGSPVLVTGNFDLTVRRLVQALDGSLDAWVLVADSAGINVWCAAGGGYFTAEKVIAAVKSSHLADFVDHHALILPQLCANGVDGWRIRKETGWGVHWGPARAVDLPAYLAGNRKKTDSMRWVTFPLKDRLEMVTVTVGFYGLLILLPVLIFWRSLFWPITFSMLGLSYFYAVVHPWLPGRDGLYKSVPLTIIALAGLFAYQLVIPSLAGIQLFHWSIGLTALSVFTAAELQGMSPLMRGEQANWSWEAIIAVVLGGVYWLLPLAVGWK
jgi:ubiquinone/menaquinone biosynthesis C-methylase UbiE